MTPRKELFIKIKEALMQIPELELIDLDRGQLKGGKYPQLFVAALIRIKRIDWETMTEHYQEGTVSVYITLYCRDGWADQHQNTGDSTVCIVTENSSAICFFKSGCTLIFFITLLY